MKSTLWHNLPISKILVELKTSIHGLDDADAARRVVEYGPNRLVSKPNTQPIQLLIAQIKSPLVYILFFAAIIALVLRSFLDLAIILVVVVINTAIGFFQEYKANRSIDLLRHMVQYKATVVRQRKRREINVEELVPGDIILLEEGMKVPADARIVSCNDLRINESALTGESVPSKKADTILAPGAALADRENMVFYGTSIMQGKGTAVVCETGATTQLGKIADLISDTLDEKTPLQIKLSNLSRSLTFIVIVVAAAVLGVGLIKDLPLLASPSGHEEGMLYTAISLAVAAIPEGLLVAVTVILAVGMKKILRHHALVRRLVAAETLGSTSVICTDKTGTLTEGRMSVTKITLPDRQASFVDALEEKNKKSFVAIIRAGALCNNAYIENIDKNISEWQLIGDPTETALLVAAARFGLGAEALEKEYPRLQELPFNSDRKFMGTLNRYHGENALFIKGSPEVILQKCSNSMKGHDRHELDDKTRRRLVQEYEAMSRAGLRVLAVAYKKTAKTEIAPDDITDLHLLGFMGISDPMRPDAKATFEMTKKAGIKTVIITGDHKFTAQSIAHELGLKVADSNILEGVELDKITDEELAKRIRTIDIFARVTPHHKLRIIDAWQKKNEVVAMTGDGVNDAPALKSADIGIALNSGTDIAKENADLVLLDNGFKTIVSAVEEGRVIFANIRKVILYLLSDSFAEITLITIALLFGLPLPLIPVQILWINLIADGLPTLSFTMEKGEPEIIYEMPRKKHEPVINFQMKTLIFLITLSVSFPLFFTFAYLVSDSLGYSIEHARTIIFTCLAAATLLYSYTCRSLKHSIFSGRLFSNPYLNFSVVLGFGLQFLAIYHPFLQTALKTVPLSLFDWFIVLFFAFVIVVIIEIAKYFFIRSDQSQALSPKKYVAENI